jgi:type II secretory pathway pseudopilin PulG
MRNHFNLIVQRKKGFSLIQVIVVAGLMGFLALVFAKMATNSKRAQTGVQNSLDFDVMRSSVQQVISNPGLCADAFFAANGTARARLNPASPPPNNQQLHSIKIGSASTGYQTIVAKNQKMGGGLVIEKLEFQNVTTSAPNNYQAFLYIEGKRVSGGLGGEVISNRANRPLLSITTNASNQIVSCNSSQGNVRFHVCRNNGTAVSGSNAVCAAARTPAGSPARGGAGTATVRAVSCIANYANARVAGSLYWDSGMWRSQMWTHSESCIDSTIWVQELL